MVEIKKCVQIIDFSGNIIYRFRDIEEVRQYNHTYWKLKGDFLSVLEASNYAVADDFLLYYEDQKIEDNMGLISVILQDIGISIKPTDKHNINRYGNQYTMDILKQILGMEETKAPHTQVDWESQVFGNYERPELNIEAVYQGMPANPYNSKPSILHDLMMKKGKEGKIDQFGSVDGGTYNAKNGSADHYKKELIEYLKSEEYLLGSVGAYLACITQVNKYAKRQGLKEGVDQSKDYTKLAFYRAASLFYKERLDEVNNCLIGKGDSTDGHLIPAEFIQLVAPQVFNAYGVELPKDWNKLAYTLEEEVNKRL